MLDKAAIKEQSSIYTEPFNSFVRDMQQLLNERGLSWSYREEINDYLWKIAGKKFDDYPRQQGFSNIATKRFERNHPHKFLLATSRMMAYYVENLSVKKSSGGRSEEFKNPLTNEELLAWYKKIVSDLYMHKVGITYIEEGKSNRELFVSDLIETVKNNNNLPDLIMELNYLGLLYVKNPKTVKDFSSSELLHLNADTPIAERVADLEKELKDRSSKRIAEEGEYSAKRSHIVVSEKDASKNKKSYLPPVVSIAERPAASAELEEGFYPTDNDLSSKFKHSPNSCFKPLPITQLSAPRKGTTLFISGGPNL